MANVCTCGSRDEPAHDREVGKDEDGCNSAWGENVINETPELLVSNGSSTRFNDIG